MAVCPACGKELPGEFPFCPYCATPLIPAGREQRKTVTVLFSDLAGFTSLSEQLSPGALVELMNEYLTAMTDIIEAEGGFVGRYIGDAIVSVNDKNTEKMTVPEVSALLKGPRGTPAQIVVRRAEKRGVL